MRCRNCGAALDAGRIDRALGIVVCAHCGGVHGLAGERPEARRAVPADGGSSARVERGRAALPERFDVRRGDGTLQVRWAKGRKGGAAMLVLFGCAWAAGALASGLLPLLPVALAILYYAAVRGFNRTELRASAHEIDIRRGPLPWRGARRHVRRADVAQLFAREIVTRSNIDSTDGRKVREHRSYALESLDASGERHRLIGGLPSPDQALWFERELERLLDIEDVAIAGEVR